MRWTLIALLDERRYRGRRSRVVLTPRRRRQVGGGNSADDGDKKSPITEESTKETVKTIAQGMPGDLRCDRGDYARVFFSFCTRGCGRGGRPAFPAPSDSSGAGLHAKLAHPPAGSRSRVCERLLFEI